jgi:hypothetical protein
MLVCFEVSGVFAILALIGFKPTYAIQDKTAASPNNAWDLKRPSHKFFWNKFEQLQLVRRVSAMDGSE